MRGGGSEGWGVGLIEDLYTNFKVKIIPGTSYGDSNFMPTAAKKARFTARHHYVRAVCKPPTSYSLYK